MISIMKLTSFVVVCIVSVWPFAMVEAKQLLVAEKLLERNQIALPADANQTPIRCSGNTQISILKPFDSLEIEGSGETCIKTEGTCDVSIVAAGITLSNCGECIGTEGNSSVYLSSAEDIVCDAARDVGIKTEGNSEVHFGATGNITVVSSDEYAIAAEGDSQVNVEANGACIFLGEEGTISHAGNASVSVACSETPSAAAIVVEPESADFGDVLVGTESSPIQFGVTNVGDAQLQIGTIAITGWDLTEFVIEDDSCSGETLERLRDCSIVVVFGPGSEGPKHAYLSVPSDDANTPVVDVLLRGVGIPTDSDLPYLTQSPLIQGQSATFQVKDVLPDEPVYFYMSLGGIGSERGLCLRQFSGLCLDLLYPVLPLGSARADASGVATLIRTIPRWLPLIDVHTQAVVQRGVGGDDSVKTNTVSAPIIP